MPSLQVRELPENIYNLLQARARRENRSLAQEAVAILATGLNTSISHKNRRKELLAEIVQDYARNSELRKLPDKLPDPATLVREDRER